MSSDHEANGSEFKCPSLSAFSYIKNGRRHFIFLHFKVLYLLQSVNLKLLAVYRLMHHKCAMKIGCMLYRISKHLELVPVSSATFKICHYYFSLLF